jgi:hypothetical protein
MAVLADVLHTRVPLGRHHLVPNVAAGKWNGQDVVLIARNED